MILRPLGAALPMPCIPKAIMFGATWQRGGGGGSRKNVGVSRGFELLIAVQSGAQVPSYLLVAHCQRPSC